MHRAPAVNFSVKRSRWQARFIACMSLLALAILVFFTLGQMALDARVGVLALAIFIASSAAFLGWKRSPQGSLRWDGQHWYWSGFAASPACSLRLLMDLQSVAVVTITADAHVPVFLWLEATPGDASWRPLRRAMVSSQVESGDKGKKTEPGVEGDLA